MPDPSKVVDMPNGLHLFLITLKDVEQATWDKPNPEPTNIELKDMIQDLTLRVTALDSLLRQTFEEYVLFKGRWIPLENFISLITTV